MTAIAEHTTEKDRSGGFRNLCLIREDEHSRCIVSVAAVRSENISFTGDDPSFLTTGNIEDNQSLGLILLRLASELLAHPGLVQIPSTNPQPPTTSHFLPPCIGG